MSPIQLVEFLDGQGRSPFSRWLDGVGPEAAARITAVLYRLAEGNFSNVKGVGSGAFERVIDYGPGYRVYFGKDGERIVILLGGSAKNRQQAAIDAAHERWSEYRKRKKAG